MFAAQTMWPSCFLQVHVALDTLLAVQLGHRGIAAYLSACQPFTVRWVCAGECHMRRATQEWGTHMTTQMHMMRMRTCLISWTTTTMYACLPVFTLFAYFGASSNLPIRSVCSQLTAAVLCSSRGRSAVSVVMCSGCLAMLPCAESNLCGRFI